MNSQFFEFWSQFFTNAARGQKQVEDLERWMQQGFSGYDALTSMFRKAYGLEEEAKVRTPDYQELWKKSMEDFQGSLRTYLSLFNAVTKDEHLDLIQKYEDLKKKCMDQEETIRNLRALLGDKLNDQGEIVEGFRGLMEKQADEFQELMKHLSQFFQKESPAKKGGKLSS